MPCSQKQNFRNFRNNLLKIIIYTSTLRFLENLGPEDPQSAKKKKENNIFSNLSCKMQNDENLKFIFIFQLKSFGCKISQK